MVMHMTKVYFYVTLPEVKSENASFNCNLGFGVTETMCIILLIQYWLFCDHFQIGVLQECYSGFIHCG